VTLAVLAPDSATGRKNAASAFSTCLMARSASFVPSGVTRSRRAHLDVRPRLTSQLELVGDQAVVVQPPGAGEQHELHVGQAEGGEHRGDLPLPAQRGVP
jgi:hypothetical protein